MKQNILFSTWGKTWKQKRQTRWEERQTRTCTQKCKKRQKDRKRESVSAWDDWREKEIYARCFKCEKAQTKDQPSSKIHFFWLSAQVYQFLAAKEKVSELCFLFFFQKQKNNFAFNCKITDSTFFLLLSIQSTHDWDPAESLAMCVLVFTVSTRGGGGWKTKRHAFVPIEKKSNKQTNQGRHNNSEKKTQGAMEKVGCTGHKECKLV